MGDGDRVKWNAIYRDRDKNLEPAGLLDRIAEHLPERGRALDIAGGSGRNAIWLAARGFDVTVADIASEGLALAASAAARAGVDLTTLEIDLEEDELPAGSRFDVVIDFHFLHRPLIRTVDRILEPGGVFVFCQPTLANLERHDKPSGRFLLDEGELLSLLPAALDVLHYIEDWSPEGRHEAELVARLPHVA